MFNGQVDHVCRAENSFSCRVLIRAVPYVHLSCLKGELILLLATETIISTELLSSLGLATSTRRLRDLLMKNRL